MQRETYLGARRCGQGEEGAEEKEELEEGGGWGGEVHICFFFGWRVGELVLLVRRFSWFE